MPRKRIADTPDTYLKLDIINPVHTFWGMYTLRRMVFMINRILSTSGGVDLIRLIASQAKAEIDIHRIICAIDDGIDYNIISQTEFESFWKMHVAINGIHPSSFINTFALIRMVNDHRGI